MAGNRETSGPIRCSIAAGLITLAAFAFPSFAHAARSEQAANPSSAAVPARPANILVLMSYHRGHSWEDGILNGIVEWRAPPGETLQQKRETPSDDTQPANAAARPVFHVEWLDTKRFPDASHRGKLARFLTEKYRGTQFDVVITVDDNALDFAAEQASLTGTAPIVFSGVNGYPDALLKGRPKATGILERFDMPTALRLAMILRPDARRVVVMTAVDESGQGHRKGMDEAMARAGQPGRLEHWPTADLTASIDRLAALEPDTLLFVLGSMPETAGGRMLDPEAVTGFVRRHAKVPLFADFEASLGHGAIGGHMNSALETGRLQAEMARTILAGGAPESLPYVVLSPSTLVFDHAELQRFGIRQDALPHQHRLRNSPPSVFDPRYRNYLIGAGLLSGVLLALVAGLMVRSRFEASRQDALRHQATHDVLTGLPNRLGLRESLQSTSLFPALGGESLTLAMVDVNRFKLVNDMYGHAFGDEVIASVARRLRCWLLDGETLVRFGSNAFAILSRHARDGDLASLRDRCTAMFGEPFDVEGRRLPLTASIGLATSTIEALDDERLLQEADTAMHEAKRSRGTHAVAFDARLRERAVREFQIAARLPTALERGELEVWFQPLIDTARQRIAGFEALCRWHHPELGNVPPPEFIRVATESAMIGKLTLYVLRQACRAFAPHLTRDDDLPAIPAATHAAASGPSSGGGPYLAVNISVSDLYAPDFCADVARILDEERVPLNRLVLEVTEDMLLGDVQDIAHVLAPLHAMGIRVAIDDFGTGYSSMSYLSSVMVDIIKIDRSFVRHIVENPLDQKIVRAIVSMAADLDLSVVTEGVETPEQAALLTRLGCVVLQGYLFAKPRPAEEWLASPVPMAGVPA